MRHSINPSRRAASIVSCQLTEAVALPNHSRLAEAASQPRVAKANQSAWSSLAAVAACLTLLLTVLVTGVGGTGAAAASPVATPPSTTSH